MAISIVQKSFGKPRRNPRIALVLSGGAISGGAFKLGGLLALEHLLTNCLITEFDLYVGISAGSLLAAPLSGGVPPQDLLYSFTEPTDELVPFGARDFYWPNLGETFQKTGKALKDSLRLGPQMVRSFLRVLGEQGHEVRESLERFLKEPSFKNLEEIQDPFVREFLQSSDLPHVLSYIPSAVFDNSRIERWVRTTLERKRLPNSFSLMTLDKGTSLYIEAVDLDTGEEAVFGTDEISTATISEAVQASTAIPGFYRPVKLGSKFYIDGSIKHTAPMEVARRKGADLIICYNPFRPYHQVPTRRLVSNFPSIAQMGIATILNQTIRAMIHSRLSLGIEELRNDPGFTGDAIVIEPAEDDAEFFAMNPLAFWQRAEAARRGYRSAKMDFERNFLRLRDLLARYGLEIDLSRLEEVHELLEVTGDKDDETVEVLARRWPKRRTRKT